jgi:hypothetical protein
VLTLRLLRGRVDIYQNGNNSSDLANFLKRGKGGPGHSLVVGQRRTFPPLKYGNPP